MGPILNYIYSMGKFLESDILTTNRVRISVRLPWELSVPAVDEMKMRAPLMIVFTFHTLTHLYSRIVEHHYPPGGVTRATLLSS